MKKEFEPPAIEWQTEPTVIGGALMRIVLLEIEIDKELQRHHDDYQVIVAKYDSGRVSLDDYLHYVDVSLGKVANLQKRHDLELKRFRSYE